MSSLRALIIRGSAWTAAGHGASQLIRLAKSLILTRLLFPEAFGLMSLVGVVMYGLQMLSDVGLAQAVIRDKRGDQPEFLNTAWTMQVVRGAVLWVVSCLIAYPISAFYGEPDLAQLIAVTGVNAIIFGFGSTALFTTLRHMEFRRLTLLDLASEVLGFVVTVLWAWVYPTVWALVGGALISSLFHTAASHTFFPGLRNAFRWDPSSLRDLVGFGKWIFLSSAVTFVAAQSDLILLGKYLDMAQLGVYSIAITLGGAVLGLANKINASVLYPAYGKLVQHDTNRLSSVSNRLRLAIDAIIVLPIAALMIIAPDVVRLLYDERYHDAGWILRILCIRLMMSCALMNSENCLVALGHPQYAVLKNICRAVWIVVGIPVGWHLAGIEGVVWAVALSEIPVAGVMWIGLMRYRLFSSWNELRSLLFAGLGALLGYLVLEVAS